MEGEREREGMSMQQGEREGPLRHLFQKQDGNGCEGAVTGGEVDILRGGLACGCQGVPSKRTWLLQKE